MDNKRYALIYKKLGQTPLEAILAYKKEMGETRPMTYAGRLDPMAEGLLVCLVGDECKNKEKYTRLDKEYEFEILIGFATDTHDILGLVRDVSHPRTTYEIISQSIEYNLYNFIGNQDQVYPVYSSKTVGGKQLHSLARKGLIIEESLPSRKIEIFSIEKLAEKNINKDELQKEIHKRIGLVKGDFRQKEILEKWDSSFATATEKDFNIFKFKIHCSSGTYIRGLVRDLGNKCGVPICVFSIKRTRVGNFG